MLISLYILQDCCLIPESPFYLEGKGGLFEYIEKRLKENNHMVIAVAEGAGQDLIAKSIPVADQLDASGNKLLLDVGLWLTHKIKVPINSLLTRVYMRSLLIFGFTFR
jgi:6-phosphofructokinase 1